MREERIKDAEIRLSIAKIDAETSAVKAAAAAEENRLIEESVKDKTLIKNWKPATANSEYTTETSAFICNCCTSTSTVLAGCAQ